MSIEDYIEPPSGGSIFGYRNTTTNENGFVNSATEGVWIAVYVFFILYTLFLLITPALESRVEKSGNATPLMVQVAPPVLPEVSAVESPANSEIIPSESSTEQSEEEQKYSLESTAIITGYSFRDGFLLLLGTALVSMAGYGVVGGAVALTWIVFALLIVSALSQMIPNLLLLTVIDFVTLFVSAVLLIIVWAIAFKPALTV